MSLVLLSGQMFVGKTTLAIYLRDHYGFAVVSARAVLRRRAEITLASRVELQQFGASIERQTHGVWLADATREVASVAVTASIVVDSVRTAEQLAALVAFSPSAVHIHLVASETELKRRFEERRDELIEPGTLETAMLHPIEGRTKDLARVADLILDTDTRAPDELARDVLALIRPS